MFVYYWITGKHAYKKIYEWREVYGDVITIYLGYRPMVFVFDLNAGVDAFKTQKDNFAAKKWPTMSE